ncbi:hypothetical protein ES705_38906 [subsurface metagenome]
MLKADTGLPAIIGQLQVSTTPITIARCAGAGSPLETAFPDKLPALCTDSCCVALNPLH